MSFAIIVTRVTRRVPLVEHELLCHGFLLDLTTTRIPPTSAPSSGDTHYNELMKLLRQEMKSRSLLETLHLSFVVLMPLSVSYLSVLVAVVSLKSRVGYETSFPV
jgi:hypothetical protein